MLTSRFLAFTALRIRVSRSDSESMGSSFLRRSPGRLRHARDLALEGELAEAQAAEVELPVISPRTPADPAAVADPDGVLRLPDHFGHARSGCHEDLDSQDSRNGMPRALSRARASLSV